MSDSASSNEQLDSIRTEIDQIDAQLTALLERRFALTEAIGKTKMRLGMKIKDELREQEVLERVSRGLSADKSKNHILSVFKVLIQESVEQQRSTVE
jgi:monofunctional chorismate mutase